LTKDSLPAGGQRIFQTKSSVKQPIVIVSKGSSLATSAATAVAASSTSIETAPTSTAQQTSNATNQNVIVLDLSQQDISSTTTSTTTTTATTESPVGNVGNNVLSDILRMTGIVSEEDTNTLQTLPQASNDIQQRLTTSRNTTTLQKVPGDSSSWIVLDSNGSSAKDANFTNTKNTSTMESANLDIFSQAMASAEIGDFSTAENSIASGNDLEKESEPPLVPPKTNSNASANILFASPHDVMPTPRQRKLDETELATSIFHENHHQNSVVVEEVGDEIITESEVVSMDDDFTS
jgi:hypothetical protein